MTKRASPSLDRDVGEEVAVEAGEETGLQEETDLPSLVMDVNSRGILQETAPTTIEEEEVVDAANIKIHLVLTLQEDLEEPTGLSQCNRASEP